jgi:alkylation response protein AidB-like acyl-CoA dehydrogenase
MTTIEDVASFRQRARDWIRGNLGPMVPGSGPSLTATVMSQDEELALVTKERQLQRKLFDAGFAGIAVPKQYGGQGLTGEHQRAFNDELAGFEYPARLQVPTMAPCLAVLLDFGTEEQKLQHVPAILKGEEIWMQFLSEPSGGSDVAGALTSATQHGDEWILNGSKIWTTGAWWSDWALCLARTNWDVPKHRGLTVFILPLNREGVSVHRIEMLNGCMEFCQEFLTDVRVPDSDRIGDVDGGWTVGTRWMFHERMLHNSPYVSAPKGMVHGGSRGLELLELARKVGRADDPLARDLIGEGRMLELGQEALQRRISDGITSGRMNDQSAAIGKLYGGMASARIFTIEYEIAGTAAVAWAEDDDTVGDAVTTFIMRQTGSIGGGTTEMARNVVSERVLGMPREPARDRDVPFRDVPRGSAARR